MTTTEQIDHGRYPCPSCGQLTQAYSEARPPCPRCGGPGEPVDPDPAMDPPAAVFAEVNPLGDGDPPEDDPSGELAPDLVDHAAGEVYPGA